MKLVNLVIYYIWCAVSGVIAGSTGSIEFVLFLFLVNFALGIVGQMLGLFGETGR